MVFVGKVAYLALFPGALFIILAGVAAKLVTSGVAHAFAGPSRLGSWSTPELIRATETECIAAGGPLHAATWITPVFKLMAISWASCIVFGFLPGDLVLLYFLLLAAAGADVLFAYISGNPRVRQQAWPEAVSLLAWALPFALATCCVALRTHTASVSALINLQGAAGPTLAGPLGGVVADVGMGLALLAALFASVAIMRFKPLGRGYMTGSGALLDDVSGPPLAFFLAGNAAMLFVAPLVLVALFFAGPASHWYQVLFWFLKVLGLLVLLAIADAALSRACPRRVAAWGIGFAGGAALAGLILVWIGVRS